VRILTLPGVFQPRSDARLLASAMRAHGLARGARVLEVFAGSGAVAVAAARAGAQAVTAVDISRRAVLTVQLNARCNGVHVRALRGDLFAPVAGERFDLILANPPYLPSEDDNLPARGAARAWEGGQDGRILLDRLCAEAAAHVEPGGTLLLVQSSLCGEAATLEALRARGLEPSVLRREQGPLGPLLQRRAELLEARGVLKPGDREEELLVIAATTNRRGADARAPTASIRPLSARRGGTSPRDPAR
jgi:release factor glutamine methyltransferase